MKLLLSFIMIISIGLLFTSCEKEKTYHYIKTGDTHNGVPDYGGEGMAKLYAQGSFSYVATGYVFLNVGFAKENAMANYRLDNSGSCSSISSSAENMVGDTVFVELAGSSSIWFKAEETTIIEIISVE